MTVSSNIAFDETFSDTLEPSSKRLCTRRQQTKIITTPFAVAGVISPAQTSAPTQPLKRKLRKQKKILTVPTFM